MCLANFLPWEESLITPILFLDHAAELGGAELYLLAAAQPYASSSKVLLFEDGLLRERLEQAGVAVEVINASRSLKKVKRSKLLSSALLALPTLLHLVTAVAKEARYYNVIFANSQKSFAVAAIAGRLARRPVVWCLHDILSSEHFGALNIKTAITLANRFAAKVIVNSKATARAFINAGGKKSLVKVVYNGIEAKSYDDIANEEVEKTRASLRLNQGPVVGVFSRLASWKGQHVLIEALTKLPNVQALLVGEALFGEDDYANTLKERVTQLGLENRVHFLGFRQDIPQLMNISDVIVHTSVAPEPFGRVVVEGMLAKKPVIASKAGGVLEIIEDGESGLLVEPGDSQALASALKRVLSHSSLSQDLGHAGSERAQTLFSVDAMRRGLQEGIAEVLSEKPGTKAKLQQHYAVPAARMDEPLASSTGKERR